MVTTLVSTSWSVIPTVTRDLQIFRAISFPVALLAMSSLSLDQQNFTLQKPELPEGHMLLLRHWHCPVQVQGIYDLAPASLEQYLTLDTSQVLKYLEEAGRSKERTAERLEISVM